MSAQRSIVDELAELDDIERMLDEDRRRADPNRGVICSRGCAAGCEHVVYLVEAIRREEDEEDRWASPWTPSCGGSSARP